MLAIAHYKCKIIVEKYKYHKPAITKKQPIQIGIEVLNEKYFF
jgi:hypothetical protein